jgi:NADH-quinone oxidoreductase subunit E
LKSPSAEIPASIREECARLLVRYPRPEGALLPILQLIQRERGEVGEESMLYVADLLGVAPARVGGVVSFYPGLRRQSVGVHLISVCRSLPCCLMGSGEVVDYLCEKLGIDVGETTGDGRFTLVEVECLGGCGAAPAMMVDEELHESLTCARIDQLLERLS